MGKRKNKKEQFNIAEILGNGATYLYLLLMLGIFPIFYPGHLIGIHTVKTNFFITVSAIYLCLILILFISGIIASGKERQKIKFDLGDIFVMIFLVSVVFSTVVALDPKTAFYGNSKIRTGSLILLLCIFSYYAIKKYACFSAAFIRAGLAASAFIYLSGIFLTCKTDLLNMQKDIVEEQKGIFVSPIGNINYNVSYVSLMLPAAMVMFLLCKELFTKRVLAVYLYIGFMNMICLRTESAVAVLAFVFVLLLYFSLDKSDWFFRYVAIVRIFLVSNISVYALKMMLKDHMYDFDGLCALLLRTEIVVLEIVFFVVLFLVQKRMQGVSEAQVRNLQKIYGRICVILAAVGFVFILVLNIFYDKLAVGNFLQAFVINDSIGNSRGYVWTRTVELFSKLPFVNQLFGCGLGCFYDFIYPTYGEDMIARFNSVFYDPHNDFLHVLATTGITGVIGFFGGIFTIIASAVKRRKNREMQIVVIMTLAAFLVQGLVNSFTIFVIPLVFIIMGLAQTSLKKENETGI